MRGFALSLVAGVAATASLTIPAGISGTPNAGASPQGARICDLEVIRGVVSAPGGPFLTDACGRDLILHGVNAVYKAAPFELTDAPGKPFDFSRADAAEMAALGFDVVRLGVIWKGLEPGLPGSVPNQSKICAPGPYRDPQEFSASTASAYLDALDHTIDILGSYGIYSLVDMHQDVYNEVFAGEGAPDWAVCSDALQATNTGNWSANYFTPAVGAAFENLWNNQVQGGLQQNYDRVWATVASHFASNPWVIGYDLFNEPFSDEIVTPGGNASFDARLECLYTGTAAPGESSLGTPIVCPPTDPSAGIVPTIEHNDPNHLIFYEPDVGNDFGQINWIGAMAFPRLVLDFHDYCLGSTFFGVLPLAAISGTSASSPNETSCKDEESLVLAQENLARSRAASVAQPRGPAWFLSEFGAGCDSTDLAQVADLADQNLIGWTYWQWKLYGDPTGGNTEDVFDSCGHAGTAPHVPVLSRPYAQATAGTPTSMSFDVVTGSFHFTYVPNPSVAAPTVVFVPVSLHYPSGFCARLTGARLSRSSMVNGVVHLYLYNRADASDVSLTVLPGRCRSSPGSPR